MTAQAKGDTVGTQAKPQYVEVEVTLKVHIDSVWGRVEVERSDYVRTPAELDALVAVVLATAARRMAAHVGLTVDAGATLDA